MFSGGERRLSVLGPKRRWAGLRNVKCRQVSAKVVTEEGHRLIQKLPLVNAAGPDPGTRQFGQHFLFGRSTHVGMHRG